LAITSHSIIVFDENVQIRTVKREAGGPKQQLEAQIQTPLSSLKRDHNSIYKRALVNDRVAIVAARFSVSDATLSKIQMLLLGCQ
jgi:hypothetical protein